MNASLSTSLTLVLPPASIFSSSSLSSRSPVARQKSPISSAIRSITCRWSAGSFCQKL